MLFSNFNILFILLLLLLVAVVVVLFLNKYAPVFYFVDFFGPSEIFIDEI